MSQLSPATRSLPPVVPATLIVGLAGALLATVLTACAPAGSIAYPMEVRMLAEQPNDGAQAMPRWCEGGSCLVGPKVVLDERNVRSVMLQPGESRVGLVLELNSAGIARLKSFIQGNAGDQRLTVVVDGKALEAMTARQTLKTGTIRLSGPRADMLRLHEKLKGD